MKQWLAVIVLTLVASNAKAQISSQFFSMHSYSQWFYPPTQSVQTSSWRTEPITELRWSNLNTASGVYDWTQLDSWIGTLQQYGSSLLFNVWVTPSWASTCPECVCFDDQEANGGCYPPNDLNSNGTGTDQKLKNFITALMQHEGPGKIKYIEVWNEPNISTEWMGTVQQLVRMTQDIRTIAKSYDPNVEILTPPETGDGPRSQDAPEMLWLQSYLAAGGGAYVDVITLHGYVMTPEDVIHRINNTEAAMAEYGQSGKPVFVTEGSWVLKYPAPTDQQPGFSFRQYLSILSTPVQRFFLMAFDNPNVGNLFNDATDQLTPNGTAYQLYYGWLEGATMTQPCQAQSSSSPVWTCNFTRAEGYQAEAIWDTALPWGQTTTVTVPSQYTQYRDLYSNVYPITNHQVPIGFDPIWMENTNSSSQI